MMVGVTAAAKVVGTLVSVLRGSLVAATGTEVAVGAAGVAQAVSETSQRERINQRNLLSIWTS